MSNKIYIVVVFLIIVSITVALLNDSPSKNAQAGKVLAEQLNCASCHGQDGISLTGEFPNLAGQGRDYLAGKMAYIRNNTQVMKNNIKGYAYPLEMLDAIKNLTDTEINSLAQYYSKLHSMHQQIR